MKDIMDTFAQFFLPMMGALGGGLSAWVAIRSQIAVLNAQVAYVQQSLNRAHERIDDLQRIK